MNTTFQFISEETLHAISWTVLHSLWQGLLIALIFSLVYFNLKNKSARFKYHLSFASLLAITFSAVATFIYLSNNTDAASVTNVTVPTAVVSSADHYQLAAQETQADWFESSIAFLDSHSSWVVGLWFVGLMFFLVRMLHGLYFVNQIRFSAESVKDKTWQQKIDKYLVNLGSSRSVEIAQSALIKMPMMIGFFKPMILFPVGVLNNMEVKEVEAIIAHELSHILRNDYLINILQSIIEVLFYFNPAVWWISSIVRSEREHSCDDMAVEITNSNMDYAKALLNLAYHNKQTNSLVMTFGGKKKELLIRVQRVLNNSQHKPRVMEKIITSTLLLVLIVGISMGANTNDSPIHFSSEKTDFPDSIFVQDEITNEVKEYISIDTLPNKNQSCQIMYYNDNKRVDIWKENGDVIKLWVDGERIEEKDFSKYQSYIDGVPDMPLPPPPPPAPNGAPPAPPAPPSSKTAPGGIAPPVPPALPAAPAQPAFPNSKNGGNDLSIIIENFRSGTNGLDEASLNQYQKERERILAELKELSEITFIDSLHPKLKIVETEDGLNFLNIEEGLAIEFDHDNWGTKNSEYLNEMAEALKLQTDELNLHMETLETDMLTMLQENHLKYEDLSLIHI